MYIAAERSSPRRYPLERRRELLLNQDTEGFVDLFAPGGVLEIPFAGPDLPARLDGQQAIRDYSRRIAASALRIDDLDTVAVHHTDDPEVLIVELVTRATVTTTGQAFTARSIQVFRIRDGKIRLFRDYVNPNALAEALFSEQDLLTIMAGSGRSYFKVGAAPHDAVDPPSASPGMMPPHWPPHWPPARN